MFGGEDLRRAWSRSGDAADDRPEEVDDIMSPQETVGFEEGLPLLDMKYQDYPRDDELLRPAAGYALAALAEHELVTSTEDLARELGSREEKVEKALDLHGVDEPEGFDVAVDTTRLNAFMGDVPERMKDHDNPLVVATLYVEKGLSVEEIRDVLAEATDDNVTVSERAVKQTLVDARLINGETTAEAKRRRKQNRGEVNHPDTSGMTFMAGDH